jgi:hypothetical protein
MSGRLRRMFSITNLDRYFRIRDDLTDAVEDLEPQMVGRTSPREGV